MVMFYVFFDISSLRWLNSLKGFMQIKYEYFPYIKSGTPALLLFIEREIESSFLFVRCCADWSGCCDCDIFSSRIRNENWIRFNRTTLEAYRERVPGSEARLGKIELLNPAFITPFLSRPSGDAGCRPSVTQACDCDTCGLVLSCGPIGDCDLCLWLW